MSRPFVGAIVIAIVFAGAAILAQTLPSSPRFEVASIKPAAPLTQAEMVSGKYHRGLKFDPSRVELRWMPLAELIGLAYGFERSQMLGPDWLIRPSPLESRIFNIQATVPEGPSKSQVPEMLRGLLAERFKLIAHREMKDGTVYGLVIGDRGSKLKEVVPGAKTPITPPPGSKIGADFGFGDDDHVTAFSNGSISTTFITGPGGDMKITGENIPGCIDHIEATRVTPAWLAKRLTAICDLRVVDMTGLTGSYQMTLDLPQVGAAKSDVSISSVSGALAKLGLKLEKRKSSIEFLVVDHVERDPTAN